MKLTGGFWRSRRVAGAMGLLARVFPPLGNIPMLSTVLFCAGLG